MKSTFLEQQRDIPVYLRGLSQDPYLVGLWSHPKVTWTAKIHLLKVHELAVAENADGHHIPANLVRHLLAISFLSEDGILVMPMLISLTRQRAGTFHNERASRLMKMPESRNLR
ncbi:hypothetical protein EDD22DRAFT_877474 [Suillus occidentalis]|nr:hypothetical protein EDD22DRAFT_877474 [Suillus occidentalis]